MKTLFSFFQKTGIALTCVLTLHFTTQAQNQTFDNVNVLNRLGVGTTSPQADLHVARSGSIDTYVRISGGSVPGATASSATLDLYSFRFKSMAAATSTTSGLTIGHTTNAASYLFIHDGGQVGIGTRPQYNSPYKLSVNGSIRAKEIVCETGWSDFVFDQNYKLRSLEEVEAFIKENKHLPEIPSAEEVEKNGVKMAEMESKLLMKVEELTLYLIEMKKENQTLKTRLEELEKSTK